MADDTGSNPIHFIQIHLRKKRVDVIEGETFKRKGGNSTALPTEEID